MGFAEISAEPPTHKKQSQNMKLVAASAQNDVMVPMEDEIMEEPWWMFLTDYGLEVTEEMWTFDVKDPKIHIEATHDGSSFIVKSPWYKENYSTKAKDNSYEMKFKNQIPGMEVTNKMYFKEAMFNKNDKVEDPNCTSDNKKKCQIKTVVGKQNKRQFEGEHVNSEGHYKVWEYNNYVHDLGMKPIEIHFRQGYDFGHHGDQALGMTMEGDMAENPWYTKGQTKIDVDMAYKMYTDEATEQSMDHWDSTVWSFSHTTDDSEMDENVVAAEGSSNVESLDWDQTDLSAEMKVNYESSCNLGWSDNGVNTQRWVNTDNCMKFFEMIYEGQWEE